MTNSIRNVMENDIPVFDCDDTIADAGRILTATGRTTLPVLNPDFTPFGLLGQRELLRFHQSGGNTLATHAWEICTTRPHTLSQDSSVEDALNVVVEHDLKELIVIDRAGRFAGIASRERLLEHYVNDNGRDLEPAGDARTDDRQKMRQSHGM